MAEGVQAAELSGQRRFAAFISYAHADAAIAAKLQAKLERYRLPKHLAQSHTGGEAALGQIFRDREDLAAAPSLSEAIRDAISQAEALVVICSPDQKQAEAAHIERREIEQRSTALRAQLATQPEQIEIGSVTKYVSALDKMKEELLALELQRTQLQQKYQPNHRLLRDHDQRLAQAKALIAQEEQHPPRERSFALNETRRRLSDDLLKAEANLAALAQREQRLGALVQEYQTQLSTLNLQSFKKSDLERERAMNEEAWLLFEKKAQEAEINAVLNQTNSSQVSLAEAPVINPRPINAQRARAVAGLLVLGLVLAMSGTILVESWHPRLRHEAGLRRRFGLDVLASWPAQPTPKPLAQYSEQ